jgi:hypothetical protein
MEPDPRFVLSHFAKSGSQFIFGHHHEPEVFIQRAVPGNVDEGSEGERRTPHFDGPCVHHVEKLLAESPTLVFRKDADLFYVGISIHDIDNDVANRSITVIHGDPTASVSGVLFQRLDRHGIGVGYPVHADRPEHFSRQALDLPDSRGLC